jgi:hypothetical protein
LTALSVAVSCCVTPVKAAAEAGWPPNIAAAAITVMAAKSIANFLIILLLFEHSPSKTDLTFRHLSP